MTDLITRLSSWTRLTGKWMRRLRVDDLRRASAALGEVKP